jgi:hypothetical protein
VDLDEEEDGEVIERVDRASQSGSTEQGRAFLALVVIVVCYS